MKHKAHFLTYCPSNSSNKCGLKDGTIISCHLEEGLWYYNQNSKSWIPNCPCPNLGLTTCNQNIEQPKTIIEYGLDIPYQMNGLLTFLNHPNTKCFYHKDGNKKDPNIYCQLHDKSQRILRISPYFYNTQQTNLLYKLIKESKIQDGKVYPEENRRFFYTKKKLENNIQSVSPQCFYSIPVISGNGILKKNIHTQDGTKPIYGMDCQITLKSVISTPTHLYIIFKNQVYFTKPSLLTQLNSLDIHSFLSKPFQEVFPKIPIDFDYCFYDKDIDSILFIKHNDIFRFDIQRQRITKKTTIDNTWIGIPQNCHMAINIEKNILFIRNKEWYLVKPIKYKTLLRKIAIIQETNISHYQAYRYAELINGKLLAKHQLYKNRNKINEDLSGWTHSSRQSKYSIESQKLFSHTSKNAYGAWIKLNPLHYICGGLVISKGTIKDIGLDYLIDWIAYDQFNNYICLGSKNNIIKGKINPTSLVFRQIESNNIQWLKSSPNNQSQLCKLQILQKNKYQDQHTIQHSQSKLTQSIKNRLGFKQKTLQQQNRDIENKNSLLLNMKNNIITQTRVIQQQNQDYNTSNKINRYLLIILFCMSFILIFIYSYKKYFY